MTYRCAIVGVSGGRANGHAEAFPLMPRGQLVAISTRTEDNLQTFGDKWQVAARYTDYDRMFREEKPDLVLVNTPPNVRLEVLRSADRRGVAGVIVEKPLAIQSEDYLELCRFAGAAFTKVAINHQLHFHPRRQLLQDLVQSGSIGEIRSLRASSRMNMAYQGTHVLQSIRAFQPSPAIRVTTSLMSGDTGLQETSKMHLAPDRLEAKIFFADGSMAELQCGLNAPFNDPSDARINTHKQIGVEGTTGGVFWSMTGWRTRLSDREESGTHVYADQDIQGQADMCEAMFDWIEDDAQKHALNLGAALEDFRLLLAIYGSGLSGQSESLKGTPALHLLASMRAHLA